MPDTKKCAGYPAWGQPPHDDVPITRFSARPGRPDGLERLCKECQKAGRAAKKVLQSLTPSPAETPAETPATEAPKKPKKAPRKAPVTRVKAAEQTPVPEVITVQ